MNPQNTPSRQHRDGEAEMTTIKLKKGPTDSQGERWYKDERLNRLAQINGGRLFGEKTMDAMLKDGSLLDIWRVPNEEIFGTTPEYLEQFKGATP